MIILRAKTDELDEIRMAKLAKKVDFGEPLAVALEAELVEDLDSNGERFKAKADIVINVALVDSAKAALSQDVVSAEALGDGLQLVQGKGD